MDYGFLSLGNDVSRIGENLSEKIEMFKKPEVVELWINMVNLYFQGEAKAKLKQIEKHEKKIQQLRTSSPKRGEELKENKNDEFQLLEEKLALLKKKYENLEQTPKFVSENRELIVSCLPNLIEEYIDPSFFTSPAINPLKILLIEFIYSSKIDAPENVEIVQKMFSICASKYSSLISYFQNNQLDISSPGAMFKFKKLLIKLKRAINDEIDFSVPQFDFLFSLALRETSTYRVKEFLDYHFRFYEGDFIYFLEVCKEEYKGFFKEQQINFITRWIELTEKNDLEKNNIGIPIPKVKRRKEDQLTSLTQKETSILINLLKEGKVIFNDSTIQTNGGISKAFYTLTGYSENTLRSNLSKPLKNFDKKELIVTQKKIEELNQLISKYINDK